ncbi:uncharacterized protein LOC128315078 [Acinonyx jubatus]|uniref:Uncharacterized protein LOC128315078 n=1 Tax=Acinonyx jubatus TaxID=32536 RepID=A0ABM3PXL4_ACIJB|nr:uncharacterized protein LOC128315078 [Acinonyx jubatus]
MGVPGRVWRLGRFPVTPACLWRPQGLVILVPSSPGMLSCVVLARRWLHPRKRRGPLPSVPSHQGGSSDGLALKGVSADAHRPSLRRPEASSLASSSVRRSEVLLVGGAKGSFGLRKPFAVPPPGALPPAPPPLPRPAASTQASLAPLPVSSAETHAASSGAVAAPLHPRTEPGSFQGPGSLHSPPPSLCWSTVVIQAPTLAGSPGGLSHLCSPACIPVRSGHFVHLLSLNRRPLVSSPSSGSGFCL